MDIVRRHRTVQVHDQENVFAVKGKSNAALPTKRQGLGVRGALGEVNSNIQIQRDVNIGKGATADCDKKATLTRPNSKSANYKYVQSKVDTGLCAKNVIQPSSRPPLRREESTAIMAGRALRSKPPLKDVQNVKTGDVNKKEVKKLQKQSSKENVKPAEAAKPARSKKTSVTEQVETLEKLTDLNISQEEDSPALPADIEDIDAGDKNSPLLMSMYIKDIYKYLVHLEEKYPIEKDHLRHQSVITGRMRTTLIDWLVEVQRQFSLMLETFHLTVGIIDRYLQVVPNIQRSQLQLVGVTAMFIASKYEEIYAPDVADFVYVTADAFTKQEMFQCEREIMSKLGFCLARPIPLSFLRRFIKAAHGTSKNHHLAKYFVDLSLLEYTMSHYRPSELAAAAMCLSLYVLSSRRLSQVWTPTLEYYSGYSFQHIEPIVKKIAAIVINVENSKYKSVYNKYLDTTLAKVSSLPQLKSETIRELAEMADD